MTALVGALAVLMALNTLTARVFTPPYPPPSEVRLTYEEAVQAAGMMSLGMRRLAADLAFIRLLMYYGTEEERSRHSHREVDQGQGDYPELGPRAMRILDLDPWFVYAAQYASAALAFNMDKPDEALAVLRHAIARDPKNWQYHAYVAAVGFRKQGDPAKVRDQLMSVVDQPDCPTMLKNITAYLNRRLGHNDEAVRLYRAVLASRDAGYHAMARAALRELGAPQVP